jgi:hypothetical protein
MRSRKDIVIFEPGPDDFNAIYLLLEQLWPGRESVDRCWRISLKLRRNAAVPG